MFTQNCDKQSCEETRQPSPFSRFRNVTMSAMFPLPYLLCNKETVEKVEQALLQPFEPLLPRNFVERKNIYIYALMHLDMAESGFRETGTIHPDFHKEERSMGFCLRRLKEKAVTHLLLCHLSKMFIVGSHHAHIDIIIPRQNLLPKVSANSRTTRHKVTDAMFVADTLHFG